MPDTVAPLTIANLAAGGTPASLIVKVAFAEYAQRVNEIHAGAAAYFGFPYIPMPYLANQAVRLRLANVTTSCSAEGLSPPADAEIFLVDRALLAAPITLTLGTTGYAVPAVTAVSVSISGTGPDVTLIVPGIGTTNHGGAAQIFRTFSRSAGGWIEPSELYDVA